ncbi:MAG: large conductance mechanosensitive channel protein MscL [Acidimicrobiales bacterium]
MIQEFKDFINKGNVVDLAVAVVLGAAFGAVVTSFVDNVLMQIVALIFGEPDFSNVKITISDTPIYIGTFLTALISFLFIALAVFFVVKAYNAMKRPVEEDEAGPSEIDLLTEIRDSLANR